MNRIIHIGTRASELAMWQATKVANLLQDNGIRTNTISITSEGDIDLKTPLYNMGVQGVFTRHLDMALLTGKIDIAVHSMKDVPTQLANGLTQIAVLRRGSVQDILLYKENPEYLNDSEATPTIATGSVRRRAQWLNRYPHSALVGLRGNVNTRIRKLQENDWDGALFAMAGLERINLLPQKHIVLDWMIPAPAQGAIMVVGRENDNLTGSLSMILNDADAALCSKIERDFLAALMGGCATPISALAQIKEEEVVFRGNILTPDGKKKVEITKKVNRKTAGNLGFEAGTEILRQGGREIVNELKKMEANR